jgi:hypothetical protein
MLDLLIVGAGPHALTLMAWLLDEVSAEKGKTRANYACKLDIHQLA